MILTTFFIIDIQIKKDEIKMSLINHQSFISNLTHTDKYILRDKDGNFSLTDEKPHTFKIKDIVQTSFECLAYLTQDETGSLEKRCASLRQLENGLNNRSLEVIQSIEKRWWYAILHFFGYKAKAPQEMICCLDELATAIQTLEKEIQKEEHIKPIEQPLSEKPQIQLDTKEEKSHTQQLEEKTAVELTQSNTPFPFEQLPNDLKFIVYSFLSIPELTNLRLFSQTLKTHIDDFFKRPSMSMHLMKYISSREIPLNLSQQTKYNDLLELNLNNPCVSSTQLAQYILKELLSFFSKKNEEKQIIDWNQIPSKTFSMVLNFLLIHLPSADIEQIIKDLLSYHFVMTSMPHPSFNYPSLVLKFFENFATSSTTQQSLISFLCQINIHQSKIHQSEYCQLILKFLSTEETISDLNKFNILYALHHPDLFNTWKQEITWQLCSSLDDKASILLITTHICYLLNHSLNSKDLNEEEISEITKQIHKTLRYLSSTSDKKALEFLKLLQSSPICATWSDLQIRTLIRAIVQSETDFVPSYNFYICEFIRGNLIQSSLAEKFLDVILEEIVLDFSKSPHPGYVLITLLTALNLNPKIIKIFIQAVKQHLKEPFQSIALLTLAKWTGRSYQEVCDPEKIPSDIAIAPSSALYIDQDKELIKVIVKWCHNFLLPLSNISNLEDLCMIMKNLSAKTKFQIIAKGFLLPSQKLIKISLNEDAIKEAFKLLSLKYEDFNEASSLTTLMQNAQLFLFGTEVKFIFSKDDLSPIE